MQSTHRSRFHLKKPVQLRLFGARLSSHRHVSWSQRLLSLGFIELRTGNRLRRAESSGSGKGLLVSPQPLHENPVRAVIQRKRWPKMR